MQVEDCVFITKTEVTCGGSKGLKPKIKRSRGKAIRVCVNESEIFSVKTTDFFLDHFNSCHEDGSTCTVDSYELA